MTVSLDAVRGGLAELNERVLAGFRLLGVDVMRRLAEEKAEKTRQDVPSLPAPRERTRSELELERAGREAGKLADRLVELREKSSPGMPNPLLGLAEHTSDAPEAAARKASWGLVLIFWGLARKILREHWLKILAAVLAAGHLPWLLKVLPEFAQHLLK